MGIAVCTFSLGNGTQWVQRLKEGDQVYFNGPKGKLVYYDGFKNYLFFGDVSTLGRFYGIRRQLGEDQSFYGVFYAERREDLFADIDGTYPFDFITSRRDDINVQSLFNNCRVFDHSNTVVYVAGEAVFCKGIYKYCSQTLGLNRNQIKAKPFWHPTKRALE